MGRPDPEQEPTMTTITLTDDAAATLRLILEATLEALYSTAISEFTGNDEADDDHGVEHLQAVLDQLP